MVGIVLAGGTGSRLYPLTKSTSKQLLPVFDKPMVFYPIATLMLAGINQIAIITTPSDQEDFKKLLGDGSGFGVQFTYLIQREPKGLADAFLVAKNFIGSNSVALILGDNIFHGTSLGAQLRKFRNLEGAQIFGYHVANPGNYGVAEMNTKGELISIEEKPLVPKSQIAIPGLYFYDNTVVKKAEQVKPSPRGELEITTINQMYLAENRLKLEVLQRGTAWFDSGSYIDLFEASSYIRVIQERQGYKVACLEEIAFRNGWLDTNDLRKIISVNANKSYSEYLEQLIGTVN
jgi:glucose-1-phosphate thymidylyltransferase